MLKRKISESTEENVKQVKVESNKEENIVVSQYFQNIPKVEETIAEQFLQLQNELNNSLRDLDLKTGPVEYIYNPLLYAFDPYEKYIRKYCTSTKELLFIGMNPGPFGMCQTGIPFGDPICVRQFLQIEGIVNKPEIECPDRMITGFNSSRREQSGKRFWEFFENLCGSSEKFFENALLLNFCPIALMKSNGSNVTPAEIKDTKVRKSLEAACNNWYLEVIRLLKPKFIVAVGGYIDKKTKDLFKSNNINDIQILCMPHPSPRSVGNQNWHEKAHKFIDDNNLIGYFQA
ncbi:unnamed protein product [Diabrotica balteata]|uniref:Uracil-DNA glycosylase-like domain-containing protein n=1 Tax=Diabrotica balteata TaxID=107213 RepID=A0A9N9XFP8_DIABA|nr:unnamed protein product [Diabrotica balteata]